MPYRAWVFIVALGLIVAASLGQAQEQAQEAEWQTEPQQGPAQSLPLPFPIVIVEDDAAAEARQRQEEESRQREIEDLIAQQGMNAATQAMNAATQDMRNYALYSTILIGVGTSLLFVTLYLTWQANGAAQEAVKVTRVIGVVQTRAYMGVKPKESFADGFRIEGGMPPDAYIVFLNYGQTPAYNVISSDFMVVAAEISQEFNDAVKAQMSALERSHGGVIIAPQAEKLSKVGNPEQPISADDFDRFRAGTASLYFFGCLYYDDVFGNECRTYYGIRLPGGVSGSDWFEHLGAYNYRDDDVRL